MSPLGFLFCLVFLSQVLLISLYFPRRIRRRVEFILTEYPPETYPKLYPVPAGFDAVGATRRALRMYARLNGVILVIGLALVATALVRGYTPDPSGGDEVIALGFFALQMIPHFLAELSTALIYRLMRHVNESGIRRAVLERRGLTDFVPQALVVCAAVLYAVWMVFYLLGQGVTAVIDGTTYVTLICVTGVQLLFVGMARRALHGRKPDPHVAATDRTKQIAATVRIAVFSSLAISAFLVAIDAVRFFELDVLEPALTSLYLQLVVAVGFGLTIRATPVSAVDFDGYRGHAPSS